MLSTTNAAASAPRLTRDTRVLVYDAPGTVRYTTRDGRIGVQLDGEGARVDEWSCSQVDAVRS